MDWASAIWAWLDANSKQLSAVASLVFGLSSAVVAWFAYRLNRRNNVGSEPMAFFTWWKIEPRGEADPLMNCACAQALCMTHDPTAFAMGVASSTRRGIAKRASPCMGWLH